MLRLPTTKIQRILRTYYEQSCAQLRDHKERDTFLETPDLLGLNPEERENLNSWITSEGPETVTGTPDTHKSRRLHL